MKIVMSGENECITGEFQENAEKTGLFSDRTQIFLVQEHLLSIVFVIQH